MKQEGTVIYKHEHESSIVNTDTGEIEASVESSYTRRRMPSEPPFIKVYLDHLGSFYGLPPSYSPIILQILSHATYASRKSNNGGMIVVLNKYLKEDIASACNVSLSRVEHALSDLVQKDYIRRLGSNRSGTYQLNPHLFGKGAWEDILEIRTTYSYSAGTVEAEIIRKEVANNEDK